MNGSESSVPRTQSRAFVRGFFFSYFYEIAPESKFDDRPNTSKLTPESKEYWVEYCGKARAK